MNAVRFTETYDNTGGLTAAHNLPPVDLTKKFAVAGTVKVGTILKQSNGTYSRWVQGTDNANLIAGVYAGAEDLDTARADIGLVRVFGPIRRDALVAATAADGSTTAAPNAAALAALEERRIYAL